MGFPPQGGGAGGVTREVIASGTLSADGTEQDVVDFSPTDPTMYYGWVDLSNMQDGDTVVIKSYTQVGASSVVHAAETYNDAQDEPDVYVVAKLVTTEFKVTLEQTAGTNRDYDYKFFRET